MLLVAQTGWSEEVTPNLHRSLQGIIVEKAGSPAVKVPDGTVYPLNKKNSVLTHGRKLPKRGEE